MENSLPDIEAEKSDFLTQEWIDEWYEEKLQEMRAALRQQNFEQGYREGMLLMTLSLLKATIGTLDESTKKRIQSLPNQLIEALCLTIRDFTTPADLQQWLSDNAVVA